MVRAGAEEIERRKGHKYLTLFVDLMAERVLFATTRKDSSVLGGICHGIAAGQRPPQCYPACGDPHECGLHQRRERQLREGSGGVRQVYVNQNVVDTCDQVRRTQSRAETGKGERLERTRWMWIKNRLHSTKKAPKKSELMALEPYVTGMAYEMRLVLQGILQCKDAGVANKLFRNKGARDHAMRGQTGELLDPMTRAALMVEGNLEGIPVH